MPEIYTYLSIITAPIDGPEGPGPWGIGRIRHAYPTEGTDQEDALANLIKDDEVSASFLNCANQDFESCTLQILRLEHSVTFGEKA